MSTTYYVRTVDVYFPTSTSSGYSENRAVYYDSGADHFVWSTDAFSTIPDNELFYICAQYIFDSIPAKVTTGDYCYYCYFDNGSTSWPIERFKINAVKDNTNNRSTISTNWDSRGWTTSNLTTFKTELATFFEAVKGRLSNNAFFGDTDVSYGVDDSKVNLVLLHFSFRDDPSKHYYFPFFYKGNDGTETIVI